VLAAMTGRRLGALLLAITFALGVAARAAAQPAPVPGTEAPRLPATGSAGAAAIAEPRANAQNAQGIVVMNGGAGREEAQALARAVYASRLRPAHLDEAHARALAGDPPMADAAKDVRELGELRAAASGDDAASRRILASIAEQLHVEAILVVRGGGSPPPEASTTTPSTWGGSDAGAGADAAPVTPTPTTTPTAIAAVEARLYLASAGDYDAARYAPEPGVTGTLAWRTTVASLERRFAPLAAVVAAPVPPPKPQEPETRPFYASPWFWGALTAAVLVGGAFYLATRDNGDQPIHLQMHVPR
jgi:hypothetical protein